MLKRLGNILNQYDSEPFELLGGIQLIIVSLMHFFSISGNIFHHDWLMYIAGLLGVAQICAVLVRNLKCRYYTNAFMVIVIFIMLLDYNHHSNDLTVLGGFISIMVYNIWCWFRTMTEINFNEKKKRLR